MSKNDPIPQKHNDQTECVDERSFVQRLWCKIDPFGIAYPIWIAVFLITLIVLFAVGMRLDYFRLGW